MTNVLFSITLFSVVTLADRKEQLPGPLHEDSIVTGEGRSLSFDKRTLGPK